MSWLQEPFDLLYRPFVGRQYPSGKKQGNVGGKNSWPEIEDNMAPKHAHS